MDVTIAVCTRDRAGHLAPTLQSIDNLCVPNGVSAEVLVVDNGSRDDTRRLLESRPVRNLPFRWMHFEPPGKCRAMNAAIANSEGRVLLWTDDDVRVARDWLALMSTPILQGNADALQGTVLIPDDLRAKFRGTPMETRMSIFGSTENLNFSRPSMMFGPNMSFGRHVLDRVPGFDEALGPGQIGYGDETLFSFRLIAAGYRLVGVPESVVEHHFDASRVSQQSIDGIARKIGASQAYIAFHWLQKRIAFPRVAAAKTFGVYCCRRGVNAICGPGRGRNSAELRFLHVEWQSYLRQFQLMQTGKCARSVG